MAHFHYNYNYLAQVKPFSFKIGHFLSFTIAMYLIGPKRFGREFTNIWRYLDVVASLAFIYGQFSGIQKFFQNVQKKFLRKKAK